MRNHTFQVDNSSAGIWDNVGVDAWVVTPLGDQAAQPTSAQSSSATSTGTFQNHVADYSAFAISSATTPSGYEPVKVLYSTPEAVTTTAAGGPIVLHPGDDVA